MVAQLVQNSISFTYLLQYLIHISQPIYIKPHLICVKSHLIYV